MNRGLAPGVMLLLLGGCIPAVERAPLPTQRDAAPSPAQPIAPPREEPPREGRQDHVSIVAGPRPLWEARPVAPDAQDVAQGSEIVRAGDTLDRIAGRTGASADAIARANRLQPPFVVPLGRRLAIPGGRYHLVRQGQSGIAIARAYGVEWSRIVAANTLQEPYVLRAGQRILIPGSGAQPPSRAERAAAFRLDIDDIITGGEPAQTAGRPPSRAVAGAARVLPPGTVLPVPPRLAANTFGWPVEGRIVTRFGPGASGERSDGIQIAVPIASPIRATADGVVAYAGDGIAALGGLIIVKHDGGWTSVYGYASKLLVQRGQGVRRGQTIALSGATGSADRPEVHFELRKGRTPVDPQSLLPM